MKPEEKSEKKPPVVKTAESKALRCSICGKPTLRLVDGEPSCDEHAALVYENQLEDYTAGHLGHGRKH